MTEKDFLEYVIAVCERPKMYTPTGTFNEVISFLEGYGSASHVGENSYHSVFTPFRNWIAEKFNLQGKIIGWDVFHEVFPSDEEGLKNLPRQDVYLEKGYLQVVKGKTKSSVRRVHLSEKAKEVLRYRINKFSGENLFPQGDKDFNKPTDSLDKQHIVTIRNLGYKFRLYDCRHTFATRAVENSIDLLTLSQILGHSSLRMVIRYSHPSESFKAEAIRRMEKAKLERRIKAA